jgi:uncharacterized protein YraI
MKFASFAIGFAAAFAVLPQMAQAQQVAYAAYHLELRAGPDPSYPVVAVLPTNAQVVVQGCMGDYQWCDIAYGRERGWAPAESLRYAWQNSYAPLPTVATAIGVTVVGFVMYDYWRDHYRQRSWYHDRQRWAHVPQYRYRHDHDHGRGRGRDNDHDHGRRGRDHDNDRDHGRRGRDRDDGAARIGRSNDSRPAPQVTPVSKPEVRSAAPARNDPNSGWDSRRPNMGPADRP